MRKLKRMMVGFLLVSAAFLSVGCAQTGQKEEQPSAVGKTEQKGVLLRETEMAVSLQEILFDSELYIASEVVTEDRITVLATDTEGALVISQNFSGDSTQQLRLTLPEPEETDWPVTGEYSTFLKPAAIALLPGTENELYLFWRQSLADIYTDEKGDITEWVTLEERWYLSPIGPDGGIARSDAIEWPQGMIGSYTGVTVGGRGWFQLMSATADTAQTAYEYMGVPLEGGSVETVLLPELFSPYAVGGMVPTETGAAFLGATPKGQPYGGTLDLASVRLCFAENGMVQEGFFFPPDELYRMDNMASQISLVQPVSQPSALLYVAAQDGIYAFEKSANAYTRLLAWKNLGQPVMSSETVYSLDANRFLLRNGQGSGYLLITLSESEYPADESGAEQSITVALLGVRYADVEKSVSQYNRQQSSAKVIVRDYSDAAAAGKGFASGSEMLNNDIISGNVPDIVLTSAENITAHIRKGLFVDLYPFIDADAQLSRTDFVAGALAATEQDGTLPTVLLSYNLLTAVGDPDVVGSTPGWTWEEFYSVLAANPQAKTPYYLYDRYYVLLYQLMLGGSDYLDYSTGTAHLDSPEFIRVLESSAAYSAENGDYTADPKPVFAARQSLLNIQFVGDFRSVIAQNYAFDGPVVYKGFPSDAGGGSAFTSVLRGGITSYCTDPDAAWQFLRTLLLPEFQDNIQHSLPVRRDSLQKLAQAAAEPGQMAGLPPYLAGVTLTESQQEYWKRGITEEESTALLELIESTNVLYQYDSTIAAILWEEADCFYNGIRSAEDAAKLIQSRVQTYLAEQG